MDAKTSRGCATFLAVLITGCSSPQADVTVPPPSSTPGEAVPPTATVPDSLPTAAPSASVAPAAAAPKPKPTLTWRGLLQPESIFVDAEQDRYLVTNVNGTPFAADNNGFISELSPDGTVKNLKLVSANEKTKLNAPKGIAVVKGIIHVADIDTVRMFDGTTGAYKGEIKIEGATFLNDLAAGPDGKIYVADSGIAQRAPATEFEATGGDAIYVIEKGKAKVLVQSKGLHQPNGLVVDDKGLIVCAMGMPEVYRVGPRGEITDRTTIPGGMLDGFARAGASVLVSSWQASTIYRGALGGTFVPVVENVPGPADFAYDEKRGRAIVPRMLENAVEAYEIK